jgi:hypothetical protein
MSHILYIYVAKGQTKVTLKKHSCDYKVFMVTDNN